MSTLNTLMAQIRVSDDAHVKIMDRRTHVLVNTVQVVDDIIAKVDGVITVPVAALNEPCKQCEQYKKKLEESNDVGLEIQGKYNDLQVEIQTMGEDCAKDKQRLSARVDELDEESERLMEHFNAANDEIKRLGGKQIVLDDDSTNLDAPAGQDVETTVQTTRRRGTSQEQIDALNEEAEKEMLG